MVADKSFAVSPTKMNVVYRTLDNPISVSVAGYQPDQLSVSANSGELSPINRKKGEYSFRPDNSLNIKEVKISLKVKGTDKIKSQSFEPMIFRVLNVSKPDVKLGSIKGNKAKVEDIMGASLTARLKDFPFEGLGFRVEKFTVICTGRDASPKDFLCKGNNISSEAIKYIRRLGKNTSITVKDVWVKRKGEDPVKVEQFSKTIFIKE